ncbi:hypothetical protein [Labrys neptuniae]
MPDSRAPVVDLIARVHVVLVAFVIACAYSAETWPPAGLVAAFFGAYFVQVWFAAYEGGFSRRRTWNWIGLILAAFLMQVMHLLFGFVLPWGQFWSWLATAIMRDGGQAPEWQIQSFGFAAGRTGRDLLSIIALLLAWGFLLLDLLLSYLDRSGDRNAGPRWSSVLAALLGLCLGWGVGLIWLNATRPVLGLSPLQPIRPDWPSLSAYAVLRCIPDKLGGVVAMLVVMLAPILVPWLASPRYRLRPLKGGFQLACLSLGLTWVVLGWLGTQPPEGDVIWQSRVLTIWYFAFFLIVLPAFAVWSRRHVKAEAAGVANAFD